MTEREYETVNTVAAADCRCVARPQLGCL